MDGPLKVFMMGQAGQSAIKYYRLENQTNGLPLVGAKTWIDDPSKSRDLAFQGMMGSDIIVNWRPMGENGWNLTKQFTDMEPITKDGDLIFPPLMVCDSDDAIDYVHPFNPVYNLLGIRNWDGELLEPGDTVYLKMDGEEKPLWVDGETRGQLDEVFDITRNLREVGYHYDTMRMAHGVTVTTESLKKLYEEQDCENVYVFPNSINPADHYFPALVPHEGVRILWEGGASHMVSWLPIKESLVRVMKDHPEATLVVFGDVFPWMNEEISPRQLETHPWVDYAAYKLKRALLDCDINLCPLQKELFADAKSGIRFYEGSLGPNPEAALAANVGPYKEIEDGKTGLLYDTPDEFAEKLAGLIENADLRKTLGAGAKAWVLANRTLEKTIPGLYEFYQELLMKQRQDYLAVK